MEAIFDQVSNEELVNILISNTPVGYIVLDKEYRIHYMNDYFMKMRNFTKENTLGRYCYDLSNNGVKCSVCAVENCILSGEKQKVIRKDILPSGELRFVEDYAIPLYKNEEMDFDFIFEIMVNRTTEMRYRELMESDFINLISSLMALLDAKDPYTAKHSKSVAKYSVLLAEAMNLPAEQVTEIEIAASLHDIGKVNIPLCILNKPDKLNRLEYSTIKMHPGNASSILQQLTDFYRVKEYVRFHHERQDGTGYPEGLAGEEIPLGARIISLADTYDAMTSTRAYRKALSHPEAMEEIRRCSGTQFDPVLVEKFVSLDFSECPDSQIECGAALQKKPQLVKRRLVETEQVKTAQKDSFMLEMGQEKKFTEVLPEKQFVAEIFENTPVAYTILSPEYDVLYASPHFLKMFGLAADEIQGKKCYEASDKENVCAFCPITKAVKKGQMIEECFTQVIKGRELHLDCYGVPIYGKDGQLQYLLEILFDRTEEENLQKTYEQGLYNMVQMLKDLLAMNDQESFRKSQFLEKVCGRIAKQLGLPEEEEWEVKIAATLCDVGMISLKDVADGRQELLDTHPEVAYTILGELSVFKNVREIIRHHHANYDGSGGPSGLAGEDIPMGARIIRLADALYEYSKVGVQYAVNRIGLQEKQYFDPKLAGLLALHVTKWME